MTIYSNKHRVCGLRTFCCIFLGVTWIFGLIFGICLNRPSFSSLMYSIVTQPVSIVGLFTIFYFPLILSYFSFLLDKPIIILIVCFLKAVSFGFSGALIFHTFFSAAWVVSFLFLFTDFCCALTMLFLWFRYVFNDFQYCSADFGISCLAGLLIVFTDYFMISPFLRGLF